MEIEKTQGVKARTILWYLTFFGFAINFMVRVNVNIAIVNMISDDFKSAKEVNSLREQRNATIDELSISLHDRDYVVDDAEVTAGPLEKRILNSLRVGTEGLQFICSGEM